MRIGHASRSRPGDGLVPVGLALLVVGLPVVARADDAPALPSVPRFAIAPSPIGLRGDLRPRQYLGVVGPRSAWLGVETGEAELWVHPLKLASGFRLPHDTDGDASIENTTWWSM